MEMAGSSPAMTGQVHVTSIAAHSSGPTGLLAICRGDVPTFRITDGNATTGRSELLASLRRCNEDIDELLQRHADPATGSDSGLIDVRQNAVVVQRA